RYPLDCSRTKKSSVAVFAAYALTWQEIIFAFIRLSLSWSTDVPGNHEVVPMDGAKWSKSNGCSCTFARLNPMSKCVRDRDGT
ncbi:unnamed protein product, partial [Urochloa humidicola]